MIRIDEIYNNTFWPWLQQNRPGTRLFFCDPPGHTDPEHLFNLGNDSVKENDYIFLHDQEPVDLDTFTPLFNEVKLRNLDLVFSDIKRMAQNSSIQWLDLDLRSEHINWIRIQKKDPLEFYRNNYNKYVELVNHNSANLKSCGHIIVSERGEYVEQLCSTYKWKTHYYFYHGWAALDWYRGYDRTYLIPRAHLRSPTRTFISPNRIVGGHRDHRVLFLYNVFKRNLEDNHISAPRTCPYEGVDISSIAQKYQDVYPDIVEVLNTAELPRLFENETTQQMSSYHLTNFAEAADSVIYVATETVYSGDRRHLTEKTFKAIALEMPFILVAPAGSLAYLREYGFKTFSPYIDETYDTIKDDIGRIEAVTQVLAEIQARSAAEKSELWQNLLPRVEYNRNHFYRGGFEQILWQELQAMLAEFK